MGIDSSQCYGHFTPRQKRSCVLSAQKLFLCLNYLYTFTTKPTTLLNNACITAGTNAGKQTNGEEMQRAHDLLNFFNAIK